MENSKMKRHKHHILTQKLDNIVHPRWTTSLGPAIKWVGSFINSAKNLAKYISIPHSEIKLQK
jgi:hypothetical protein